MSKINFQELIDKINEVPLSDIIALRVELVQRGRHYFGVCPFHEDHNLGSFSVNDEKRIAKCFSCNTGVNNGIHFISKVDNISPQKAVLTIATELGFITMEDAKNYGLSEISSYSTTKLLNKINKYKESDKKIADEDIINLVYKLISSEGDKFNGNKDVLSKEHRDYLHSRGISDEDIKRNGYFTMPNRRAVVKILKKLSAFGFKDENLSFIPGFYFNKEKNFFTLKPLKGIGIPIKNINKKITAIQVRRDGNLKPGEQRYFWWSSSNEELGASPGSPIDINIPSVIKTDAVFITEGHFKADALIKKYECPAISVQGVGNWKGIPETLRKFNAKSVWIAYDADMAVNPMVMAQAIKLGTAIKEKNTDIKIFYVVWDYKIGKGIDDYLLTNNKPKKISYDNFIKKYELIKNIKETDKELLYQKYVDIFLKK